MRLSSIEFATKVGVSIASIAMVLLFGITTLAATETPNPDLDRATPAQPNDSTEAAKKLGEMSVTPPPKESPKLVHVENESEYFYKFSSSMGPRLGLLLDPEQRLSQRMLPRYILGFFYMLPSIGAQHLEVGADLLSNSTGTVNGSWRYIFNHTGQLRPFVKGGLSILIEPTKGLGNLVFYKQYRARLGIGIEDLLQDPISLRWDIELNVGIEEISVNLVFGYSWAW